MKWSPILEWHSPIFSLARSVSLVINRAGHVFKVEMAPKTKGGKKERSKKDLPPESEKI